MSKQQRRGSHSSVCCLCLYMMLLACTGKMCISYLASLQRKLQNQPASRPTGNKVVRVIRVHQCAAFKWFYVVVVFDTTQSTQTHMRKTWFESKYKWFNHLAISRRCRVVVGDACAHSFGGGAHSLPGVTQVHGRLIIF